MGSAAFHLLSLLSACLPLAAQEKLTLRYAFQPGQVTWMQQTQQLTRTMSVRGRDMATNMTTNMWLESKVTEVNDGVATIESRYARVAVQCDFPMTVDYDSDVEGSKAGAMKAAADLVGKTAKVRVDATGKILELTAPHGLEDRLESSGISLKRDFEQLFVTWPKDPVAIGETWKNDLDVPMGSIGPVKTTVTSKLVAMKDQVATVEVVMAMDTSGATLPGSVKVEITVPKACGVSKVGLATPMPFEATMAIEMNVDGGKGAPMTSKQVLSTTMKQVPAPAPKKPAETPKKDEKKGDGK